MKTKGTVLFFAYECYPYHRKGSSIGAQRPYQFAQKLSALGWKVIVLCAHHEQRNTLHKKDLAFSIAEILDASKKKIEEDAYTIVALPSLIHHGWADYLWKKTVRKGPGDTYLGKGFPYSLLRKLTTFYNQLVHGDYSWSWVPVARTFFDALIKEHKVDVIIGEHSPDAGIILADQCARQYDIPWVADFRDPALWPFRGLLKFLYTPVLKRIISSAVATINVNPYWTSLDEKMFEKSAHAVLNGYDKVFFDAVSPYSFTSFTVSYFGSFDDHFQDVKPSLKSFAHFLSRKPGELDAKLFYRGLSHELFLQQALDAGVPLTHTDIQGYCDREEAIAFMKGSHVLLIYSIPPYKARNVYEQQGFYPGKLFEYIGANRPMLLIPSDHGMLEALVKKEQLGKACDAIDEAAHFLMAQYTLWSSGSLDQRPWARSSDEYSREAQAAQLDRILSDLLNLPA
jgi:hypothetical protein